MNKGKVRWWLVVCFQQNKGEIHSQTVLVLVPFFEEHLFKWYSWVEERVWGCNQEWKKVSVKRMVRIFSRPGKVSCIHFIWKHTVLWLQKSCSVCMLLFKSNRISISIVFSTLSGFFPSSIDFSIFLLSCSFFAVIFFLSFSISP